MTQKLDIYKNIYVLPIWNYYQITKEQNLKYLYKADTYEDIEVVPGDDLVSIWQAINYQFGQGTLNLKFQRLKLRCLEEQLNFLITGKGANYNKFFAQYKKDLDKSFTSYSISEQTLQKLLQNGYEEQLLNKLIPELNVEYDSYMDMYKTITGLLTYEEMLLIRMDLTDCLEYKSKKVIDIEEEAANLEQILGNTIDVMTCSVAKFYSYKKVAQKKVRDAKSNRVQKPDKSRR